MTATVHQLCKDATDHQMANTTKPLIRWGWLRAILFFLGWGVVLELVKLLKGNVLPANFVMDRYYVLYALFKLIGVLGLVYVFRKGIERKEVMAIGLGFASSYRKDMLRGVGFGFGMVATVFVALLLTRNLKIVDLQFSPMMFLTLFSLFAISAAREEILTRGGILSNLMASMNPYLALSLSAAVFAFLHFGSPHATLVSTLNIFLAGLWLGIYYIHKQNLWFPIGAHLAWNLSLGPIFGNDVSGFDVPGIFVIEISGSELMTGGRFGFEGSILTTIVLACATCLIHRKYR